MDDSPTDPAVALRAAKAVVEPARARPARRGMALFRSAAALPVAALVVPLSILMLVGWFNWVTVRETARAEMLRGAETAAEYGRRTLESYALAAGRVNDRLRGLSDDEIRQNEYALHLDLRRIVGELSQSDLAYVIDRDGYPLTASNLFPVPRQSSLADRDYFQALRATGAPPVFVSRTFIGRFDGRLLFSVARRRAATGNPPASDGFDGVVLVSVSPLVLAEGMARLLPRPTDRMALMREDGYGISTTSGLLDLGQPLPQVAEGSPFYDYAKAGAQSAIYMSTTAVAGDRALLAMRRIDGFPVYAVAIRPRSEIVARWWDVMATQLAFALPAILGLFLLSLKVWRDQRRLAASNAVLTRDNLLSSNRLDRTARFGLVGTFEFDLQSGDSRRSPEYMSIHGLPAVATVETHDDWANRVHPDDRARAEAEVARVLSDESGATDYAQTYRIVLANGEVRWIAARGEILRDEQGRARMLLGAHVDVTPLRTTEMALAESDARLRLAQEAVGIGAWEWIGATRVMICSPRALDLCGFPSQAEQPGLGAILAKVHPDDRAGLRDLLMEIRKSGGFNTEFRIRRNPASDELSWLAMRARLVTGAQIADPRLVGIVYDITDRKRSEEMATLMAHEVEHRAKNALAVVASLLRMTKADSAEDLARIMGGRVQALSRTMALLGKGRWTGADLRAIVENELEPFARAGAGADPLLCDGPDIKVGVDAAQPLSMALHELATNAAKYGALSVPGGHVAVAWRVEDGRVHLTWTETGGPPVDGPPTRSGFGSRLIGMLFEGQMQGSMTYDWQATGLVCRMTFPAGHSKAD